MFSPYDGSEALEVVRRSAADEDSAGASSSLGDAPWRSERSDASANVLSSSDSLASRRGAKNLGQLSLTSVKAAGFTLLKEKKGCQEALESGGYTVKEVLGRSGNGGVMVRRVEKDGQEFAAKCIYEYEGAGSVRKILQNELSFLKRLKHKNIVEAVHFAENFGGSVLIQELCAGTPMEQGIAKAWPPSAQRAVADQILDAVAYLHILGIAHRDLHLGNVMIDDGASEQSTPKVKLIDFGSARDCVAEVDLQDTSDSIFADDVNVLVLPPEGSGRRGDMFSCDVFAVGLLLMGLMTRRSVHTSSVYDGDDLRPTLFKKLTAEAEAYLRMLLDMEAEKAPTAQVALDTLPLIGQWPEIQPSRMRL